MENEKVLSPEESLALITNILVKTRENYDNLKKYFILWGFLLVVASFVEFILRKNQFSPSWLVWPILMPLGACISVYMGIKTNHEAKLTYQSHFILLLWKVLLCLFFVVTFISVQQHISPFIFTMILAGMGTIMSGIIMQNRLLIAGGVILIGSGTLCAFLKYDEQLLLSAIGYGLGYVLPNCISPKK